MIDIRDVILMIDINVMVMLTKGWVSDVGPALVRLGDVGVEGHGDVQVVGG